MGAPELKPEKFGRYVLLDRIGAGGMAEVFRAVMPGAQGFKQTFVVKRIIAERAHTADFVDMFVQEARIGALLNHPNIVQVFDFGAVDGDYFLAMEYLRGHDVSAMMRKLHEHGRMFPVPAAAFVAHEVASCLGYAHALTSSDGKRLNVVHRDVSPSNIMCLKTGGVKLLDFGIAKVFGEASVDQTQHGLFKGKIAYVPPERIRNGPVDGRGDLFALGVVLWEMLAGRRLFRGRDELETLRNVLEKTVPPPSSVNEDVPASLDRIVLRALERDPELRYPSGQEMADDLATVLGETKFTARMLPDLLSGLFGLGSTSQAAMSALTPELLATFSEPETASGSATATKTPLAEPVSRPRRGRLGLLGGMVVAAAAIVGAMQVRGVGLDDLRAMLRDLPAAASAQATSPAVPAGPAPALVTVTAPQVPASTPTPAAPEPLAPAAAEPAAPAAAAEPAPSGGTASPASAAKPAAAPEPARKRAQRHRVRAERDRVMRGLSIDPFAGTPVK